MPVPARVIRNAVNEHRGRLALADATDGSEHTYGSWIEP